MTDTAPAPQQLVEHAFTADGGPLPESLYLTTITRERVAAMDAGTQAQALGAWQAAGFPAARDVEGNSVHLEHEQLRAICTLLASFERTVDDTRVVQAVTGRLDELSDGERWTVAEVARGHGIDNVSGLLFTDGELFTLARIVDRVLELRDAQPAPAAELEPLPEPGRTVPDPVDEPGDVDMVPPDGKVADIVAWVDGDPHRARAALKAEHAGKGRKTLLSKLELLAEHGDAPAPAGSDVVGGADDLGECSTCGSTPCICDPFDGINGEAPSGRSDERVVDLMGALEQSVADAKAARKGAEPPGVKVPDIPPPSVTAAGGRLSPEDALRHLEQALEHVAGLGQTLEQLADRIRTENGTNNKGDTK